MLDRDGEFIYIHNKEHIDDKCFENDGYMVRPITASEVDEVYSVTPYAIYKGHKVALMGNKLFEKMAITPTSMDNAVSYTHLDVYKRQEYMLGMILRQILI